MTPKTQNKLRASVVRAARTFGQASAAYIIAKWFGEAVLGDARITVLADIIRTEWDPALGAGFTAFLIAFGWNTWKPVSPETGGKR